MSKDTAMKAEQERTRRIMAAAMESGETNLGLHFLKIGRPAAEFERVSATLTGKPGSFGHMAGIGPGRTAHDINAELASGAAGQTARALATAIVAAGQKAGLSSQNGSRA